MKQETFLMLRNYFLDEIKQRLRSIKKFLWF